MPIFKLTSQTTINEDYQGVNISEFTFSDNENLKDDELIDFFIHSESFTEESRREQIKNSSSDVPFLRQAFEIDLIKIDHFKHTDKSGIAKFLNDFAEQDDWQTDRDDFLKIKDKFLEFLENGQTKNFYVIDKDWLDQNDERLRQPESWIYIYYFLIIWTDKSNKILTVSEWTYD